MESSQNVKVSSSGRRFAVTYVATVNKVKYYSVVGNPEKVFTEYELILSRRKRGGYGVY